MTLYSSLFISDAAEWLDDPDYNESVRVALDEAFRLLKKAKQEPLNYQLAYVVLIARRDLRMAAEQRMRLEFALALAYLGDDAVPYAQSALQRALDLARRLDNRPAQVYLYRAAGLASFLLTEFASARDSFLAGLNILDTLGTGDTPADPELTIDFLIRLGSIDYEMGIFDRSADLLQQASASRALWLPDAQLTEATIAWNMIQHQRLNGQLDLALATAKSTVAIYAASEPPYVLARIQAITAEIALDIAETFSSVDEHRAWSTYMDTALQYTDAATSSARSGSSPIGKALARLALIRSQRALQATSTNRLHSLEVLERTAHRIGDPALLGRVWTALADEFAFTGNIAGARGQYHKAQLHFESYDLKGMARLPFRARLRLEEMNVSQ